MIPHFPEPIREAAYVCGGGVVHNVGNLCIDESSSWHKYPRLSVICSHQEGINTLLEIYTKGRETEYEKHCISLTGDWYN